MSEVARRPRQARAIRVLLFTLVVVAVFGMGVFFVFQRAQARVMGRVSATGTSVGSFAFATTDCASGQAFVPGFFGADLRGRRPGQHPQSYDLRVVDTGDDAQLWLFPPGATRGAIPIVKRDCARWDVLVEWAHVTVNRVQTVSGHLHVTCGAGGGSVTADADFVRCAR